MNILGALLSRLFADIGLQELCYFVTCGIVQGKQQSVSSKGIAAPCDFIISIYPIIEALVFPKSVNYYVTHLVMR